MHRQLSYMHLNDDNDKYCTYAQSSLSGNNDFSNFIVTGVTRHAKQFSSLTSDIVSFFFNHFTVGYFCLHLFNCVRSC